MPRMAAVLMPEPLIVPTTAERPRTPRRVRWPGDQLALALVVAVVLAAAGVLFFHFHAQARALWTGPMHDRNGHFQSALQIGQGIRSLNPVGPLREFYNGGHWGPVHGLLVATTTLLLGPDYRLAVLPNLAAWAASIVLAFLLARRLVPRGGNLAGFTAALFLLASPAHRAFATDFMIESLGACLTLLALYAYVRTVQSAGAEREARFLALVLTVLFFTKYNYWVLTTLPLVLVSLPLAGRQYVPRLRAALARPENQAWLRVQLRNPLNALFLALVLALGVGWGVRLGGRPVSLNLLGTLGYLAYLTLAARCAPLAWHAGRPWLRRQPAVVRCLVHWTLLPIAISFLVPRRLATFVWSVAYPHGELVGDAGIALALQRYAGWFVGDYHAGSALAVLTVLGFLAAAGMAWLGRLRPGSAAVLVLVALALVLTVKHPNRKSRFLHSWVPVAWVGAGVGLATVIGRWGSRRPIVQATLGGVALVGLAAVQWPALASPGRAPEGGLQLEQPSDLDLIEPLAPELDAAPRTLVLSNVPLRFFIQWNVLARHGSLDRLDEHWWGFGERGVDPATGFRRWLQAPPARTIVVYRFEGDLASFFAANPEVAGQTVAAALLREQAQFQLVATHELPRHRCTVEIWRRAD
jgi:hypothetical protein